MPTNGQFIRLRLVEAADEGVVIADLHRERKSNWRSLGIAYKKGTYQSFARLFYWLVQLGWVELTGITETSHTKGGHLEVLSPRTYYRITSTGLSHPEIEWTDLIVIAHPEWSGSERARRYRLPSGRPRGRPRIGPPIKKKERKVPKVRKPKRVIPEVVLNENEKERVIKEFIEIFNREPTRLEIYELFSEELKLKQRKAKEEAEE